jgi:hypothetical protein
MAGGGNRAAQTDDQVAFAVSASDEAIRRADIHFQRAFATLKWISFCHSCIYLALLLCAFALGSPQPETFVLGMSHGLLWIFMSIACIAAARARVVPLRLAVAVAVLGGIGPFFGSYEFIRAQRRRRQSTSAASVSTR